MDIDTGRPVEAEEVQQRLAGHFDTLEQVAAEAGLSKHATEEIAKARRVLEGLKAAIAFFWALIGVRSWVWNLPEPAQQWMREQVIPGFYLRRVAQKAPTAEERHRLRELSEKILARVRSPDGLWGTLSCEVRADLEGKAQLCAEYFQRSSCCVQGRPGGRHHGCGAFLRPAAASPLGLAVRARFVTVSSASRPLRRVRPRRSQPCRSVSLAAGDGTRRRRASPSQV